ncbi:MAG: YqaA family protein [Gemmobacter sp.]|uniref:YqaA family protein n=1 Tax=Gemmobacter sp. TaxID=1898957 RepID=UPI00391A57A3
MDLALTLPALALAAFVAATPVPMNSELPFVGILLAGVMPLAVVLVAAVANTLGSVVTWAAGRGLMGGRMGRLFRVPPDRLARAEAWFARWGRWSLLLSWAPGGDFLCLAAGALRMPLQVFLPLVALAKTARYAVLAAVTLGLTG